MAKAVESYKDLARLEPNEPSHQLEIAQTAEQAGDAATAIKAYERYLKLAPDDPSAGAIRQRIRELKRAQRQAQAQATAG
jgi:regulator of sirC expression with transglutaminase-like and TPR domain